ncbi:unnamed protein product [Prorocentrum cordatum]|nr:unnamed protein product [Polarella glacialis]
MAATGLGLQVPGLQAFHTSVLVDGLEYCFGPSGVSVSKGCGSHRQFVSSPPTVLAMGYSRISGDEMRRALSPLFRAGSYDLLRKNCNAFSDCALYYLLGARLAWRYRGLDQIGAALGGQRSGLAQGILRAAVGGAYVPNPAAAGFSLDASLQKLSEAGEVRRSSKASKPRRSSTGGGRGPPGDLPKMSPRSSGGERPATSAAGQHPSPRSPRPPLGSSRRRSPVRAEAWVN